MTPDKHDTARGLLLQLRATRWSGTDRGEWRWCRATRRSHQNPAAGDGREARRSVDLVEHNDWCAETFAFEPPLAATTSAFDTFNRLASTSKPAVRPTTPLANRAQARWLRHTTCQRAYLARAEQTRLVLLTRHQKLRDLTRSHNDRR
jgi:hypothetical protein